MLSYKVTRRLDIHFWQLGSTENYAFYIAISTFNLISVAEGEAGN